MFVDLCLHKSQRFPYWSRACLLYSCPYVSWLSLLTTCLDVLFRSRMVELNLDSLERRYCSCTLLSICRLSLFDDCRFWWRVLVLITLGFCCPWFWVASLLGRWVSRWQRCVLDDLHVIVFVSISPRFRHSLLYCVFVKRGLWL